MAKFRGLRTCRKRPADLGEKGLRPYGIAVVALSPGWTRTELAVHAFKADKGDWRQVEALRRARIDTITSGARSWPGPRRAGDA